MPDRSRLPIHFWIGLLVLLGGETLLLAGNRFVAVWFTPNMWTGYILLADGVVFRLTGSSWLTRRRREFALLAILSVGVWLLFEVYNFRLQNWYYVGVPTDPFVRDVGYFWSFATIMPGVFESADLISALISASGRLSSLRDRGRIPVGPAWLWFMLGLAMVTIPPLAPAPVARYLFGSVWIGFILLIDPVNERLGAPSFRAQLRRGRILPLSSLLLAGLFCGFLWEAWNYQAFIARGAYWVYTIPEPLRIFGWHYGKMPVLGLLGFPPFALELYAIYTLLREMLGGERLFPARD